MRKNEQDRDGMGTFLAEELNEMVIVDPTLGQNTSIPNGWFNTHILARCKKEEEVLVCKANYSLNKKDPDTRNPLP